VQGFDGGLFVVDVGGWELCTYGHGWIDTRQESAMYQLIRPRLSLPFLQSVLLMGIR